SPCSVMSFFFQAEDGIRDFHVTGVQTCALPISCRFTGLRPGFAAPGGGRLPARPHRSDDAAALALAGAGYSPGRVPRLDQPDGAASSPGEPAGWRPGLVSCIPGWTMNAPEPGRSCPPSPCAQGTIRTTPGVLP